MARKDSSTLGIKVLALFIAVLIWILVFYQEGTVGNETFNNIPINPQNIPPGLLLVNDLPTATIKLKGSERELAKITEDNVIAYIDLLSYEAGFYEVEVKTQFTATVDLDEVTPKTISIDLQQDTSVELEIKYEYTGESPTGITPKEPEFKHKTIKVSGPYNIISTLNHVFVTFDLTNTQVGENISQELPYKLITNTNEEIKESRWEELRLKVSHKYVSASIAGESQTRTMMKPTFLPITGNLPGDYMIVSIDWNPKVVSIKGDYNILTEIKNLKSKPLNLNGITKNKSYSYPLIVQKGVEILDNTTLKIDIKVEKIETKFIKNIKIEVHPDNIMYDLGDKIIEIQIKGPSSSINKTFKITASIDISKLSRGSHTLPVKITGLPPDVYLVTTPTVWINLR
jgi:YbbR domain-containing protein